MSTIRRCTSPTISLSEDPPTRAGRALSRPFSLSILLGLSVAAGGCAADAGGAGEPEWVGAGAEAVTTTSTVHLDPHMSCESQPGVEPELTAFVTAAEKNLQGQVFGGVAGYAVFASRRASANSDLCAVSAAGGMAMSTPPIQMAATTTTAVGSVSKVLTAAYMMDVLKANGAPPGIPAGAAIGPYLPPTWLKGPGVAETTFFELMTHTSGMPASPPKAATAGEAMKAWVQNGCLAAPTLSASALQYFGGSHLGVSIGVMGSWGPGSTDVDPANARDRIDITQVGSTTVTSGYVSGWSLNADGERWDGGAPFLLSEGDYLASLFFNDSNTKRVELPFHISASGDVTQGTSTPTEEACPFRGAWRYNNAAFQILPLIAANISQPSMQAYLASVNQPVDPMQLAGMFEEDYIHASYTQPLADVYAPGISAGPSCNSYQSYYAWAYPVSSPPSTVAAHAAPGYWTGCGQGTWNLSAQDLNLLLDRMHWHKAGVLGPLEEQAVEEDIYGTGLRYGYDRTAYTPNGFKYTVKGGLLPLFNNKADGTYQAMAAHFPGNTTVTVVVNSLRDYGGQILYDPINEAWDDSHPTSIWISTLSIPFNDPIPLNFTGAPSNADDWIGLYPRGVTPQPGEVTAWVYVGSGTHVATFAGGAGGIVKLTDESMSNPKEWPPAPGKWSAYYFPRNGFTPTAQLDFEISK